MDNTKVFKKNCDNYKNIQSPWKLKKWRSNILKRLLNVVRMIYLTLLSFWRLYIDTQVLTNRWGTTPYHSRDETAKDCQCPKLCTMVYTNYKNYNYHQYYLFPINKISQVTNLFFVYVAVIQQKWSQALNLLLPILTSQM